MGNRSSFIEPLEQRLFLAADVLSYHNDLASTGQNTAETVLTRSNVNSSTFGKLASLPVTGQVYAQPLIKRNVDITTGSFAGVHDVVFVATQHDQLYAFDAGTLNGADSPSTLGQLLWQRNFLDITNANNHLPSATSLTTVPQADVIGIDITVEIGITSTPVIDAATNTLYVITKTKETVAGVAHWVQRLRAINIQDGTDRAVTTIGDTTGTNTNNTQIYVYSNTNGAGNVVDPYNGTGQRVIQFNALRQANQPALALVNGVVYAGFGSHGDNGPFHGWMIGWDKTTLALKGVLNTTPVGTGGGLWMSGGAIAFDGTHFYVQTGDGTFTPYNGASTASNPVAPAPGPITGLDANGFPADGNYGDSFLKIALDPNTTPTTQNKNGWGLKIVDYFTPFNEQYLDQRAIEVGSGAPLVFTITNEVVAFPNLLVGAGMEGVIYLINRNNMGKFGLTNNIVQNLPNQLSGLLATPAIYNGQLYFVQGFGGVAKSFTIANGHISTAPTSVSADSFANAGSTPSITSNGNADGIVWDIDRGTNQLRAYSSDTYATELYTSAQALGNRDALGTAVKYQVPTVANGHVYAGSGIGNPNNALVVYGLFPPPTAAPNAPTNLLGQQASTTQINLGWNNNAVTPNVADSFYVDQSPNGINNWQQIATTGTSDLHVSGLTADTTYYFRVRAHNAFGFSDYAYTAAATSNGSHNINFTTGFIPTAGAFTFNGGAAISGGRLNLTTAVASQARSAFFNTPQNISTFTTRFTYVKNGTADGATFVIQRDPRGPAALGGSGGQLGYGGPNSITPSLAFAINIYTGSALGTEFLTNGTVDFNYSQSAINTSLNSTPITVTLTYNGALLTAQITQGAATETKTLLIDLPALLGDTVAYLGFTGATGSSTATQDITSWFFDRGTPSAIPSQPDLLASSDTGLSDSDNITRDNTPTFSGIAAPGSNVAMRVNGQSLTNAQTSPSGIYTITTGQLVDGNALNFTAVTNGAVVSAPSQPLAVTIDTAPPAQVSPGVFQFLHFPQSVTFNFAEPASALANGLTLSNLTGGFTVPPANIAKALTPSTIATWTFPGYPNGVLPDGNYHAALSIGSVSDVAGNTSNNEFTIDFYVLAGDLNRDRAVTISDFIDLSANFNKINATYTDGDLNYDGVITISDFIDLAANFNKTIPAPAQPQPAAGNLLAAVKRRRHRLHHRR